MRRYIYNYQAIIRFSNDIARHYFKLRSIPCTNSFQQVVSNRLDVNPSDYVDSGVDGWQQTIQYGSYVDKHDSFIVLSSGEIQQSHYYIKDNDPSHVFVIPTQFTDISLRMKSFLNGIDKSLSTLKQVQIISNYICESMIYQPGATRADTVASVAFSQKQGVCQDYAHILIAMCRHIGIFARYVNGFLIGEGETHAWVEFFDRDGWYAIDPTHNRLIDYGYIKIAHGRDAADCSLNRGVFNGTTNQLTEIRVIVEEI